MAVLPETGEQPFWLCLLPLAAKPWDTTELWEEEAGAGPTVTCDQHCVDLS